MMDLEKLLSIALDKDSTAEVIKKFTNSLKEMLSGYDADEFSILSESIEESNYSGVLWMENIPFVSVCRHHMMPFFGEVKIGYIPNGKICGIGRFACLVDSLSRRLQIQEDLTKQIADTINSSLSTLGVCTEISATHTCFSARGQRSLETKVVTKYNIGHKIY